MLNIEKHGAVLDGVAANAAEASRTAELVVRHASAVTFTVHLTQSAASALTATLYKSVDDGSNYAQVHSVSIASGTGTASEYSVTESVAGSDTLCVDLDVSAATHVKIIVSATDGGEDDLITVYAGSGVWS
mgnify:CR=1 FL=1